MSTIMGDGGAKKEAKRQAAEARRERQTANEEAGREQQRAERGAGPGSTRGRNMLVGQLSSALKQTLGG